MAWGEAAAAIVEATKAVIALIAPLTLAAAEVGGVLRAAAALVLLIMVFSMWCAERRLLAGRCLRWRPRRLSRVAVARWWWLAVVVMLLVFAGAGVG